MKKILAGVISVIAFLLLAGSAMAAYTIQDDAIGGDCTQIGVWDAPTKTCTLTIDLSLYSASLYDPVIVIANNNITFDGNGHNIIGSG